MNTAERIRVSVAEVERLRQQHRATPAMGAAFSSLKALQARRFAGTYSDLLASGPYAPAARFFLVELYGDRDFAERDAQFARIAGAVERLFPRDVADMAAALAELHALTESLDHTMAVAAGLDASSCTRGYLAAWRQVGRRGDRERQLERTVAIGEEMARLVRLPGLRLMLRMMRAPAHAAGLSSLQRFLEAGFDTFAALARGSGRAQAFLAIIREREQRLLQLLFDGDPVSCETELARLLGQAR